MGERQANDPNAMPLDAFISEAMSILKADPRVDEIVVRNAAPFRDASYAGVEHYRDLFKNRNATFFEARKKEWESL